VLGTIVVASFLFWIYALSGLAKRTPPDTLGDRAFALAAEPRCAVAAEQIKQLPPAQTSATPADRAATVDAGTAVLRAMVADLRRLTPPAGGDHALITAWLADWDRYLASRDDYSLRVRSDPRARFLVDVRDNQAITVPLDNLATVNHMPSCATPGDV
jgi:hypothetical protein